MSILDKIKAGVSPKEARPEPTEAPVTDAGINADEKADVNQDINDAIDQSAPDQNASHGVQDIQAITLVWGKGSLAALLCLYASLNHIGNMTNNMLTLLPVSGSSSSFRASVFPSSLSCCPMPPANGLLTPS